MAEPPDPEIDPKDLSTRNDSNTAADLAGEFVVQAASEGCAQGCAGGCGCMVLVAIGLVFTVGSAVAAMAVR